MSKTFFASAEFESRRDKVRAAMDGAGIDLLLVSSPENVLWLCGYQAKGIFAMTPLMPAVSQAREHLPDLKVVIPIEDVWSLAGESRSALPCRAPRRPGGSPMNARPIALALATALPTCEAPATRFTRP